MKISNLSKLYIVFGILTAALLMIVPLTANAVTSGGGLPGSQCPTESLLTYDPPPFIGQVRVFFNNGEITASTIMPIEQFGQGGCFLSWTNRSIGSDFEGVDSETAFRSLSPGDMHGVCTNYNQASGEILCDGVPYDAAYIELVSTGNMTFHETNSVECGGLPCFDASAVIMILQYK